MPGTRAFLRAICADPEDDAPRLIFADWLEEHGEDHRAEFIRIQCELARWGENHRNAFQLEVREQELLGKYEDEWLGQLRDLLKFWVFARGFVEEVGIAAPEFLQSAGLLFQQAPVQILHLDGVAEPAAALAVCRELGSVRFLDLSSNLLGDNGVHALAFGEGLERVRGLNLTAVGLGDAGAEALACCPYLADLKELYLVSNEIGGAGARALAGSQYLAGLRTLYLDRRPIGPATILALLQRYGARPLRGRCLGFLALRDF